MAAINKSFVIKNGLEVSTDLIFADAQKGKIGIGTTNPQYSLHVKGGIGATDSFVSGISTTGALHVGTAGTVIAATAAGSVGLGTTNPQYKLHVIGGIGVTDSFVTGVSTVLTTLRVGTGGTVLTVLGAGNSIGIGTASPQYLFHINSPVSTGQTALYVQGDVRITGDLSVDDITFDDATLSNLTVTEALNVTSPGISTFGGYVDINSNVDISGTLNVSGISSFVGLATFGNGLRVVAGVTTLGVTTVTNITAQNLYVSGIGTIINGTITNLNVTGISTLGTVKVSSGIITATSGIVTYFGDGNFLNLTSNPSRGIGIGTTGGLVGYGITFLDLKGAGVSTTFYNSSVGIATIFFEGGGGGSGSIGIGSTFTGGAANGDLFYHIDYGRIFVYYDEVVLGIGTDAFWVDAAPFNVGIITALSNVSFSPGSAVAPSMFFIGDNQTGFFSPGNGQFTVVSSGSSVLNVNASGIRVTGIVTATSFFGNGANLTGVSGVSTTGSVNTSGIITATSIVVSAGTTALPSISPTGDSNTGIFFPSADTIAFGEGGAEAMRVDSSGRLLIGISTSGNANGGILQLGSGITFPATAVAATDVNTLDDYEEGTWSPSIYGTTTAGTTTYFQRAGTYTKVGRVVTVQVFVNITNQTGTGVLQLGNLPFTAGSGANTFPCAVKIVDLALTASYYPVFSVAGGTTYINMEQTPVGGGTIYSIALDTSFSVELTATYFV